MRDALFVRRLEGLDYLCTDLEDLGAGHRTLGDSLRQRPPFDILHCNEADTITLADVVDDGDVWMVECRGRAGLADETAHPVVV